MSVAQTTSKMRQQKQQVLSLLLAVCGACALLAGVAEAKGAEFTPSVVLTTMKEMENSCEQMVDNALTLNSKSIKFVPTVHFYGSETNINSYCYRYRVIQNLWGEANVGQLQQRVVAHGTWHTSCTLLQQPGAKRQHVAQCRSCTF